MKKVTLKSGAFNKELLSVVGDNKIGWSGDDHLKLTLAILPHLQDAEGNPASFTAEQKDTLTVLVRPTEEVARRVLNATVAAAGYTLDATAERTFLLLLNMAQFADYLAKTKKPGTQENFITKEKKRGVKKDTFASLIAAPEPLPLAPLDEDAAPTETEDEAPQEEEQAEPESMEPTPVPTKPTTAKPAAKK